MNPVSLYLGTLFPASALRRGFAYRSRHETEAIDQQPVLHDKQCGNEREHKVVQRDPIPAEQGWKPGVAGRATSDFAEDDHQPVDDLRERQCDHSDVCP